MEAKNMVKLLTPRQRMLNAYRGIANDRVAIAPEFWYYYPAKLLGLDMIEFERHTPFHLALKTTFEKFDCEGWGIVFCHLPNSNADVNIQEMWINEQALEVQTRIRTSKGIIQSVQRYDKHEPSWITERFIKNIEKDLSAYETATLDCTIEQMNVASLNKAYHEVGDSYLLEGWLGVPFFDYYGGGREGGLEAAIFDFISYEAILKRLQEKYIDYMVRLAGFLCQNTLLESFCIGCSWSCNSLIGPVMWRKWDKPVIQAVCDEIHRRGKLLHIHFHGKCLETVADFAAIGIDCVCPFERPPGGDVVGLEGLKQVASLLYGKTTMNGNVHTVETLIRGKVADVQREVGEILSVFKGNNRVIVGTGDQVGRETPEENLYAMIETAKNFPSE
jgi:uroporphyrinogen decarboxylase